MAAPQSSTAATSALAQALVPAAGEDSSRRRETSLDAARKSACATKIVAVQEDFGSSRTTRQFGRFGSDRAMANQAAAGTSNSAAAPAIASEACCARRGAKEVEAIF